MDGDSSVLPSTAAQAARLVARLRLVAISTFALAETLPHPDP